MNRTVDTLKALIISMRPKQWIKNFFVFAGLIFSKSFLHFEPVARTVLAFILFSIVSGCVYIINDALDKEKDSLHPKKCSRPIASGKLGVASAIIFCVILLAIAFSAAFLFDLKLLLVLSAYFILTLAYSLYLKNFVIIDVIILAMGFVLRVVGGGVVIGVKISEWLLLCTTLISLFLALHKRKNELLVLSDNASGHRKNLQQYTPELIDGMLSVITSACLMSYCLYTFTAGKSSNMMFTIPFVIYGIFRYQYVVSRENSGGSPELVFLKDKPLLVNSFLWVVTSMIIVAFFY